MLYLDTSLLVAAFTYEPSTDRALAFMRGSRGEPLLISEWVTTEFAAALSLKIRTREIEDAYRAEALAVFADTVAESMEVAIVTTVHFKQASRFANEYRLGLRAGDALHLAIANDQGATLCTLDKRLAAAGNALSVAANLI